jgi:hypothetical protein
MCLDSITEELKDPTELVMCGWKEFNTNGRGDLTFQNQQFKKSNVVPLNEWITAEGPKLELSWRRNYKAGFHIYCDEVELKKKNRSVRRVYYRGVETIGEQSSLGVVIARQMYVPSDPDGWPPLRK